MSDSLFITGSQEQHIRFKAVCVVLSPAYPAEVSFTAHSPAPSTVPGTYQVNGTWVTFFLSLPRVISLYFGISLIITVVIWEVGNGVWRGAWVAQLVESDLGSDHDLTAHEFEPLIRLCDDSSEPGACFRLCPHPPPPLMCSLSLSLSKISKH